QERDAKAEDEPGQQIPSEFVRAHQVSPCRTAQRRADVDLSRTVGCQPWRTHCGEYDDHHEDQRDRSGHTEGLQSPDRPMPCGRSRGRGLRQFVLHCHDAPTRTRGLMSPYATSTSRLMMMNAAESNRTTPWRTP